MKFKIGLPILFCFIAAGLVVRWAKAMERAPQYAHDPSYDAYGRVQWWIQSASCAKSQRKLLVVCEPDGVIRPIEDVSLADDRGEALAAGIVGLLKSHPLDELALTKINISLNAIAVFLLAVMLWMVKKPWTALLAMGFGGLYAVPGPIPGPDIPAAFIGIYVLAMLPVVWIASAPTEASRLHHGFGDALALAGLASANLFRQPMGLIAVGCSTVFIFERLFRTPVLNKRRWGVILVLVWTSVFTTSIVLQARNWLYHLAPSPHVHSHGLSHALYLGLGAEPNPWGIQWNDAIGFRDAGMKDWKTELYTPGYYATMRHRYIQILLHHPLIVARIYGVKLRKALALFRVWGLSLYWAMGVLALSWGIVMRYSRRVLEPVFRTSLAFMLMFLALLGQGMLTVPWGMYLYPMKFCLILALACFADGAALVVSGTPAVHG